MNLLEPCRGLPYICTITNKQTAMNFYQFVDPEVLGDNYLEEQAILRKMAKDAFQREARKESRNRKKNKQ